jgi:hypothetical protein
MDQENEGGGISVIDPQPHSVRITSKIKFLKQRNIPVRL